MEPNERTCYACAHFEFDSGSRGYSEWTPGWPATIRCAKSVWTDDLEDMDRALFAKCLNTAKTCPKFELRKDA